MSNIPKVFDEILHGNLRPWLDSNKPDARFAPLLSSVNPVYSEFPALFEINFFRPFNNKTKYYHKLITSEANSYSNLVVELINEDPNHQLMKYWINDTLNKRLKTRIKEVGKLIRESDYAISYINPQKTTFDVDTDHKTDTYIMQLLKVALIKCFLEIQEVFKSLIKDDILIEEDFYTQLLNETIPEKSFLKSVVQIEVVEEPAIEEQNDSSNTQATSHFNSFTYNNLQKEPECINDLYDGLKSNKFIASDTGKVDFKKVFSGKDITNPIVWTGSISELHYFIKYIHNIRKSVVNLKQHQWEVACNCFIRPDGSKFDRKQLKEQKKPQSTAALLEKIANNLL